MKILTKMTFALGLAAGAMILTAGQDANAWVSGHVTAPVGGYDPYPYPAYAGGTVVVRPGWGGGRWQRPGWHGGGPGWRHGHPGWYGRPGWGRRWR